MREDRDQKVEQEPRRPEQKQAYERPRLRVLGTLSDLTRGTGSGTVDGASGS